MRISVLASGSSGNAVVVEADGVCVLIDCGISYRQLAVRMKPLGLDPGRIEAVLLTHEHDDHVKGLEVFLRRHAVPVLATAGTLGGMALQPPSTRLLASGREVRLGGLTVVPVQTCHDAREPVGFVLESGHRRVGLVTDTGVFTGLLTERLSECHAVLLECNHDRDLLRVGPYPWPLKQRIASRTGHLSNDQACAALERLAHSQLEVVVGMHLSQTNNRPEMVKRELSAALSGSRVRLEVASQHSALVIETGEAPAARAGTGPR
ncbi:MAG: MBL fold metallo-hydrolase [Thermoanaerobaculaceae bacterium]